MPSTDAAGRRPEPFRPAPLPRSILREVWDQVPVGVVVLDEAGRVIYANTTAALVMGLSPEELADVLEGRDGRLLDSEGRAKPLRQFPAFVSAAVAGWHRGTTAQVTHDDRPPTQVHLKVIRLPDSSETGGALFVIVLGEGPGRVREWAGPIGDQGRTLAELSRELAVTALNAGGVVNLVAEELAGGEGELCVISLLQDDGLLRIEAAAHANFEVAEFFRHFDRNGLTEFGAGLVDRVAASAEPMVVPDLPARELIRPIRAEPSGRIAGAPEALRGFLDRRVQLMLAPMIQRSAVLGTIALARWETESRYTASDLEWLTEVAELAALALANARLHDEAAARLVVIEATRRVDHAMAASVDERLTLDVILDQLLVHMGIDAAAVLVPNEVGDRLEVAASAGLRSIGLRSVDAAEERYARALALGRSEVVPPDQLPLWLRRAGLVGETFEFAEILPLLAHGEPVGLLELFKHDPRQPNPEQRLGLDSLAVRAGLAVEAWREGRPLKMRTSARDRAALGEVQELSRAQLAVLRLLSDGASNREIAGSLHISENTVKSHLREIFRKLGTRTRLQAAMKGAAWLRANSLLEQA